MRQRRNIRQSREALGDITQRNITMDEVPNSSRILYSSRILLSPLEHHLNQSMNQLEVEKRKSLAVVVEHSETRTKHQQYLSKLNKLKKYEASPESIQWRTKVASMEGTLQKCIDTYNQHLSNNSKLRTAIDQLRIAKKTMKKRDMELRDKIAKMTEQLSSLRQDSDMTIGRANQNRSQILDISQVNNKELKNVSFSQPEKLSLKSQKPTIIPLNSSTVMKNQLHKSVTMNKQLHRYINVYQNQLVCIDKQFQKIKEVENIKQLSEIQENFIVAEERNQSLSSYMNYLSKRCNKMEQYVLILKEKISQSRNILLRSRQDEVKQAETKSETIIQKNDDELQEMLIEKIKKFQKLDITIEKDSSLPEEETVECMLMKIQKYLCRYLQSKGKRDLRLASASRMQKSMIPPTAQSQVDEGRLLDLSEMVKYAEEHLQKHKIMRKIQTTKSLKNDSMLL